MTESINPSVALQGVRTLAVLFADVAGSTKLYETLGDALAKRLIDECLVLLRAQVTRHGGRVVKTIGDELMCVLPDADKACLAATDMQLRVAELPQQGDVRRAIRVGFQSGPVIEDGADVFGDTVNVAARMASVAKAGQIMTTAASIAQLAPLLRNNSRRIAALAVKGKGDALEVCEILWQSGEELTMATPSVLNPPQRLVRVRLRYGAQQCVLDEASPQLMLGRDAACAVPVQDRMASRQHARLELRQGKPYLQDQSTNGSFVRFDGEDELVLRREEVMLRGAGRVAFGRSVVDAGDDVLYFEVGQD